jgi:hypothetical protein
MSTPFGILPPSFWNFGRVLEEVDDLAHFLLRLVDARNVRERDVDLIFA